MVPTTKPAASVKTGMKVQSEAIHIGNWEQEFIVWISGS